MAKFATGHWLWLALVMTLASCQAKMALRRGQAVACANKSSPGSCPAPENAKDKDTSSPTLTVPQNRLIAGEPLVVSIELDTADAAFTQDELKVMGGEIAEFTRQGATVTVVIKTDGHDVTVETKSPHAKSITVVSGALPADPDDPPSIAFGASLAAPSEGPWPLGTVTFRVNVSDDHDGAEVSLFLSSGAAGCGPGVESDPAWKTVADKITPAKAQSHSWDASTLEPGTHVLCAKADDKVNAPVYKSEPNVLSTLPPRFSWVGSAIGGLANLGKIAYANGKLYVIVKNTERILKFDAVTGNDEGWIGAVDRPPTGGAPGCVGLVKGDITPGWCKGGFPLATSDAGGFYGLYDIGVDGAGNLYALTFFDGKISRFNADTGALTGWIGIVKNTPTGGASGCTGATMLDPTPGWCLGGTAMSGSLFMGDAGMYHPLSMAVAQTGEIFVNSGFQIKKYAADGSYVGWIGKVGTIMTPTGGAAGCVSTANAATPGWCIDGMATFPMSWEPGGFYNAIKSIAIDQANNLYAVDPFYAQRFDATTGAFTGWAGKVDTSPTGGDAGCAGASVGTKVTGWCTGGAPQAFSYDHAIDVIHAGQAYGIDRGLYRMDLAGARENAWTGVVATTPASGAAGCTSTATGAWTPGWCSGGKSEVAGFGGIALDTVNGVMFLSTGAGAIQKVSLTSGALLGGIDFNPSVTSTWRTSGVAAPGAGDGMLYGPSSVAVDQGKLIVGDNGRLSVFDRALGSFKGWMGSVGTTPKAGAPGCSLLSFGDQTPGQCLGGSAHTASPYYGMMADDTHFYVMRATRLERFDRQWVPQGWIGVVDVTPTGGAAGCTSTASGQLTPGWCLGGSSKYASADGSFYTTSSSMAMEGDYIYVVSGSRVNRYGKSSGAYEGWIGQISATKPTGGAPGCTAAATGSPAPGWCLGGMPDYTTTLNGFSQAWTIAGDGKGRLIISDYQTHTLRLYDASSGTSRGWLGTVSTTPTGGATGCTSAQALDVTPGWCVGGALNLSLAAGESRFKSPTGMAVAGRTLYVIEALNRIAKIDLDTGAHLGWQGFVASAPTGGAPGCAATAIGDFTPGWCQGGSAKSTLDAIGTIVADKRGTATLLYVPGITGRVMRFYDEGP